MAEICLELKDIRKSFEKETDVLKGISLAIGKGEFITLLGSSGCGKTTTLRIIAGLETPDGGQVFLDGKDVTSLAPEARDVNTVFQNYALFPHMNVADNIGYGLKLKKTPKEEIRRKVKEMLELVQLPGYEKRKPSELSGGQKQRVAIARALANDPKVLLCDEATSALDPQTTKSILKLLEEVNKKLGITIVIITHQMEVVKDICDRVAVMDKGTVVETGRTIEVFSKPEKPVTKSFIETASNISRIYEMMETGDSFTEIGEGDKILILTYSNVNTKDALISHISREYGVDASIIFANVEIMKDNPLGKLVIFLKGSKEGSDKAIEYLKAAGVDVEVIKG